MSDQQADNPGTACGYRADSGHSLRGKSRLSVRDAARAVVPLLLLLAGLMLQRMGLLDLDGLQESLVKGAVYWWMPLLIVLLMVAMYALALPGSSLILVAGMIYPPFPATLIAVAGGVGGGVLAYQLALRTSSKYLAGRFDRRMSEMLNRGSGFLYHCILRSLPGFPHVLINYTSGALKAPLLAFIGGACVGYAVKGFVYTSAVHDALHVEPDTNIWSLSVLWPLLVLVVLALLGLLVERWMSGRYGN